MHLLIKNVHFIENGASKKTNFLIKDGIIEKIDSNPIPPNKATIIEGENLYISAGWMDVGAIIGEPGLEHREDFHSASRAASKGGFTQLAPFPNTDPVIHDKTKIQFLKNNAKGLLQDILPIGAISKNVTGRDMAALIDMSNSGAIAFSDGQIPIQSNKLMLLALQYAKFNNFLIINTPQDHSLSENGVMHEGYYSTTLGSKGIPSIAEEMMIQRDLNLLKYSDSRLLIHNLSSANGVNLIRNAKKEGLNVRCSVPALNLLLTDEACTSFDSNYKLLPPLRSEKDRLALIEGIKDGTIDCIVTNHCPLEIEEKKLEFLYASFGAATLETAISTAWKALKNDISIEKFISLFTSNLSEIFNFDHKIQEGAKANLTIFSPNQNWTVTQDQLFSKGVNNPLIGVELPLVVKAVINNSQYCIF